jgi:hypothetical protein
MDEDEKLKLQEENNEMTQKFELENTTLKM